MLTPQSAEFEAFLKKLDLASVNQAGLSANLLTVALHSVLTRDLPITPSGARPPNATRSAAHQGNFNRCGVRILRGDSLYMGLFLRPVGHPDNQGFNAFGVLADDACDPSDTLFELVEDLAEPQMLWQHLMTCANYERALVLVENRLLHLDTCPPAKLPSPRSRPRL